MKKGFSHYLLSIIAILLLWWAVSVIVDLVLVGPKSAVLPNPISAFSTLIRNWGQIWPNLTRSAFRLVVSLTVAVLFGSVAGLIVGFENRISSFISPVLYLLYPIPKIVFLPVIFILLGLGDISRILFIFLVAVFQVAISARDAAKNISSEWVKAVQSSGGTRWQTYRHVVIPATLPSIFSGARISVGLGIAALYLSEIEYTHLGVGQFIHQSWRVNAFPSVFAGILAFALLGLVLYFMIDILERLFCKWNYIDRR